MAIYYVDPYINATVGGIQGTNIPSARTGTWADPFSALDILNGSSSVSSINGVTIVNGDEIRFKGLSTFDDFVFGNIQTTYGSNYYTRSIPAGANQTTFSNWKTALNTAIGSYRGPYFISDTDHTWIYENIASTDIPKGLVMGQCTGVTTTTAIFGQSGTSFNLAPIFDSYRTGSLYLKLIKPTHIIKQTTTQSNILNFNVSVTISAGWTSATTQDGQTVFAMMQNGSSSNVFGFSTTSLATKLDLDRFHFFRGNYVGDSTSNTTWDFRNLSASYTHRIGTISAPNVNPWSYFYFQALGKQNINLKIGVFSDYYTQHQTYNNGTNNTAVTISTFHGGLGHYRLSDSGTSVTLGNLFVYSQYSGNALMYFGSSTTTTDTKFLANSYLCGSSSMAIVAANYFGTITFLGNAYNFESPEFQAAMPGALGTGPVVNGIKGPLGQGSAQLARTLLNPASWKDRVLYSCFGGGTDTSYVYGYSHSQINSNMGILDTNGVDYKSSNSYIPIRINTYISTTTWGGDLNYTFEANTFDKKVISTTTSDSTSVGSTYIPLICYNDTNNNLVIQCNSNSITNQNHSKRISLGYIDIAGKTAINVSLKISKNIDFGSSGVQAYITYKTPTGAENYSGLSSSYNSSTLTWTLTATLPTSFLISTSSHIGLIVRVTNTVAGYTNTYTIKDIEYTVV